MSRPSKEAHQTVAASRWVSWGAVLLLLLIGVLLWRPVSTLFFDPARVRAEVEALGPLAPFGFLLLTVAQIVVAPIPGHPTQLLGGALFGVVLGSVYNVVGMMMGGLLATWLARRLGRPWLEKQVEPELLARYEGVARLETTWVWIIILLIPLGDFPYYVAGLSRLKLSQMALAIFFSRGPFTVLVTWLGSKAIQAPVWLILLIFGLILGLVAVGYAVRKPVNGWLERQVLPRLH
jgi:uncharacterized membrane protein YdjX (TVP38/TMEM64 family)